MNLHTVAAILVLTAGCATTGTHNPQVASNSDSDLVAYSAPHGCGPRTRCLTFNTPQTYSLTPSTGETNYEPVERIFTRASLQFASGDRFNAGLTLNGALESIRTGCSLSGEVCRIACGTMSGLRARMREWNAWSYNQRAANGDWTRMYVDNDVALICAAHGNP